MKRIFVIILNFNGGDITLECLESIYKSNLGRDFEMKVVVVDNGSTDGSPEKIRKKFSKVVLIENQANLGFTGGSNEGASYALKSGADFVLLLNNDTIVHPSLVKNLLVPVKNESVGGVVPKIYFEKGYEFHKDRYKESEKGKVIWYAGGKMDWSNLIGENIGVDELDHRQFDIRMETELATGCCFMIRASILSKIGLFDDRYFLYYEDADLSERIKKAGYKIMYEPSAVVWHKNAESTGGSGSELQDYYITRNRLLFGITYAGVRTKLALARESLNLLARGRRWQRRGVMDFYLRRFGRGSFPI